MGRIKGGLLAGLAILWVAPALAQVGTCQTSSGKKFLTQAECSKIGGSWGPLVFGPPKTQAQKPEGQQPQGTSQQPAASSGQSCSCEQLKSSNGGRYFTSESACLDHVKKNNPSDPTCTRKNKSAISEARGCNLASDACYKGWP